MCEEVLRSRRAVYLASALRHLELVQVLTKHTTDKEFSSGYDNWRAFLMVIIKRYTAFAGHLGKYG